MPTYEYKCPKCDKVLELSWKDVNNIPSFISCPDCGERAPRKYSLFLFSFSPYLRELREGKMVDY